MFFVILVDDVYCVAIHDLSPVLTALFFIELGGFNIYIVRLPKRSSASTMYANHNICNFETTLRKNTFGFMQMLEQSTNSIISTLYQSWIVRFDIWNSWIKSLYVT